MVEKKTPLDIKKCRLLLKYGSSREIFYSFQSLAWIKKKNKFKNLFQLKYNNFTFSHLFFQNSLQKIDCPDGFDELSCTYKDRTTTQRIRGTTILPNNYNLAVSRDTAANTTRSDKRTIRTTTIKRKVKS